MHTPDIRHDVARARARDRLRESREMIDGNQPPVPRRSLNWHARLLARSGNLFIAFGRRLCHMAGTVPASGKAALHGRPTESAMSLDKGMA